MSSLSADSKTCAVTGCPEPVIYRIFHYSEIGFSYVEHLCCSHGDTYSKLAMLTWNPAGAGKPAEQELVQVILQCIVYLDGQETTLIIMKELGGTRLFLLPGDYYTAGAIGQSFNSSERPGSHHAMAILLAACGASLHQVVVDHCDSAGHYYTNVVINTERGAKVVDMRPSDALSLSHVCRKPFLVKACLLR